jgi:hypothetical protein
MTLSLTLDIIISILLCTSIWYSTVLNKRLNALRKDKGELDQLTSNFGDATLRAGDSIVKLKQTAEDLKGTLESAGKLRDDLKFLVERGAVTADRIEQAVRASRRDGDASAAATIEKLVPGLRKRAPVAAPVAPVEPASSRGEAERELLKALRAAR